MKKIFAVLVCIALLATSGIVLAACSKKTNENGNPSSSETGSWEKPDSPAITDDIKNLFSKLEIDGANYTPVALLGTQVVAGMNYRVLCKVEPVVQNPVAKYAVVTLYADLDGNVELTEVINSEAEAPVSGKEMTGAWEETASPEVTEEAKSALAKASETLAGAEFNPVALLATQVVAGTNYSMFCEMTPSVSLPDAKTSYAIITVYQDLQGNAELTETFEFENAE